MAVKIRTRVSLLIAALMCGVSIYLLLVIVAPHMDIIVPPTQWNTPVVHSTDKPLTENRLYIPRLKLNLAYRAGDTSVLSTAIWHRYPERGDPQKGGNFILAGHRFELGLTPGQTRQKSPFYRLDHLQAGDKILVDYNGVRYSYQVEKRFTVHPSDTSIENYSKAAKMTLYSCTFGGTRDGREVITAKQIQKNVPLTQRF